MGIQVAGLSPGRLKGGLDGRVGIARMDTRVSVDEVLGVNAVRVLFDADRFDLARL